MRILAIRGQNIQSLADRFEIDLAADPLASAGLFAIVGETGAGKSSILDAMCLALYDNCPRVGAGGSEEVPDGAGRALTAGDTRNCLRRGVASGFAEVDYVGADGLAYRARWAARRARGKSDGTLQDVERTVSSLDASLVRASGKTEVAEFVERTTGLSFDEFCRTVLLPQGEFDALLSAKPKVRAELLEKITGTSEYREISRRAYQRCAAAEAEVATLEQRMAEHKILSSEARGALDAEAGALAAADEADALVRGAVDADLARYAALETANRRLAEAEAAAARALAEYHALADERTRFARLRAAEPLRTPFARVSDRKETAGAAGITRTEAEQRLGDAGRSASEAARLAGEAAGKLAEAQGRVSSFEPAWEQAAQLDTAVNNAGAEIAKAEKQGLEALAARDDAARKATELDARLVAARTARDGAVATLDQMKAIKPLADQREEVLRRIAGRGALMAIGSGAERDADAERTIIADCQRRLAELVEADAGDQARRAQVAADIAEATTELQSLDVAAVEARQAALASLYSGLQDMRRAAVDHDTASGDLRQADIRRGDAETALAAAREEEARRGGERDNAVVIMQALASPLAWAEAVASDAALHLRHLLEPGEPCPVCGSPEHPSFADEKVAAHAAELRVSIADADRRKTEAENALIAAAGAASAASARIAEAHESGAAARQRMVQALDRWSGGIEACGRAGGELGLALELPSTPSGEVVAASLALIDTERERLAAILRKAADLRTVLDKLVPLRQALTEAIEARSGERELTGARLSAAQGRLDLAIQAHQTAAKGIAELDLGLGPMLAPAGIALAELGADADAAVTRLSAAVDRWMAAVSAAEAAERELAALGPLAADAAIRAELTAMAFAAAEVELGQRRDSLAALRSNRAALLGGEATSDHRSRIQGERDVALALRNEAAEAASVAASGLAAAREALANAGAAQTAANTALADAEGLFAAALAEAGFDAAEAASLLAVQPADVTALQARLEAAEHAFRTASAAVEARREDFAKARELGVPEASPDDLRDRKQALEAARAERLGRIGEIREALRQDQEKRAALGELELLLQLARQSAKVWADVSAAIGSRDGDRFARFAQGVTLEALVELANEHLTYLKPRYRLVRAGEDLGMHVIDRDMGDAARATRTLSGGERFLVSLALALALSGLGGRQTFSDVLFIDEGFGSLDADSLEVAVDALEALQGQGRTVGVISHVEGMKDRIPVQVRVKRQGAGRSTVSVHASAGWTVPTEPVDEAEPRLLAG